MFAKLTPAILIALSIVAAAAIVRTAPDVDASTVTSAERVYLQKVFAVDEEKVFGEVPQGKKLLLMDFYAAGVDHFEVLADGVRVGPRFIAGGTSSNVPPMVNFTAGLEIRAGQTLSIRRGHTYSGIPQGTLSVGGVVIDE